MERMLRVNPVSRLYEYVDVPDTEDLAKVVAVNPQFEVPEEVVEVPILQPKKRSRRGKR